MFLLLFYPFDDPYLLLSRKMVWPKGPIKALHPMKQNKNQCQDTVLKGFRETKLKSLSSPSSKISITKLEK